MYVKTTALAAALLACLAVAPANAANVANGFTLNGFTLNGFTLNGFTLNGCSLQGVSVQGTDLNGIDFGPSRSTRLIAIELPQ